MNVATVAALPSKLQVPLHHQDRQNLLHRRQRVHCVGVREARHPGEWSRRGQSVLALLEENHPAVSTRVLIRINSCILNSHKFSRENTRNSRENTRENMRENMRAVSIRVGVAGQCPPPSPILLATLRSRFIEEVKTVAANLGMTADIIRGEELRERGFGGIYGVGKAAQHPLALVVLSHKPPGTTKTIGKGILYDTGGLSIKVCGLAWSPDGRLFASGGNDNILNLWQAASYGSTSPSHVLSQHQAAVKALAWCPWQQNILASGGGTADRTIRVWNASNGSLLNTVDTKSQVCSLVWASEYKELVPSHGYANNEVVIWGYPQMTRTAEHVLHTALSPDGLTLVSAGADKTQAVEMFHCRPQQEGTGESNV